MGEVFDLLLSLGDFESFKEVMLSYKRELAQVGFAIFRLPCTVFWNKQCSHPAPVSQSVASIFVIMPCRTL